MLINSGSFYDPGIIYYDSIDNCCRSTSYPANQVLIDYYYSNLKPISHLDVKFHIYFPLIIFQLPTNQRVYFEKWVISKLKTGCRVKVFDHKEFQAFTARKKLANHQVKGKGKNTGEQAKEKLKKKSLGLPEILEISYFDLNQDPERNQQEYAQLYVASSHQHPYWNLIIHIPPAEGVANSKHQLVFIQVSLQTVRQHDSEEDYIAKSFTDKSWFIFKK